MVEADSKGAVCWDDRSRAVASSRKLQREVDLSLKRIRDGIMDFHILWGKMEAAEVLLHACIRSETVMDISAWVPLHVGFDY